METTTVIDSNLVTGIFHDKDSADGAYTALLHRGYSKSDIHLLMSDDTRKKNFSHEVVKTEIGSKAAEGTGVGAAIGGAAGAIAAGLAAVGSSILIPGLGLVIAGPIAAALAGAGAGGVTGGILGALVGAGIPRERAVIYEKGIQQGYIVLGVHANNAAQVTEIEDELRLHNAYEIHR